MSYYVSKWLKYEFNSLLNIFVKKYIFEIEFKNSLFTLKTNNKTFMRYLTPGCGIWIMYLRKD